MLNKPLLSRDMDEILREYGLWIDGADIRSSVPWRKRGYEREGPLSAEQVQLLAEQFNFHPEEMRSLSTDLGLALSTPHLVPVPRSKATARANREIVRALADLTTADKRIREAIKKLELLDTSAALDRQGAALLDQVREELSALDRELGFLKQSLEDVAKSPQSALVIAPVDKRKVTDKYRQGVLSVVFEFWHRAGRKLSYSTDWETSERRGPLIEFSNAVVECITDPPSRLSGDTIIRELANFTPIPEEVYEAFRGMFKQSREPQDD